jgi:hypothetical protein
MMEKRSGPDGGLVSATSSGSGPEAGKAPELIVRFRNAINNNMRFLLNRRFFIKNTVR